MVLESAVFGIPRRLHVPRPFTVASPGTPDFQWQEDPGSGWADLQNNTTYSGVNTATLTIFDVSLSFDGRYYRCIVTEGNCNATSGSALLTVIPNYPVAALGIGLGVDYAIYMVDSLKEEYACHGDMERSIIHALNNAGRGVIVTATPLVACTAIWYIFSSLRFQAEMAILIAIWMNTRLFSTNIRLGKRKG